MRVRRLVMVLALTLIAGGFGASRGLAHMQQTYNGACGQLVGFPGLLQKMNFFAQGNCKVAGDGTCQSAAACQFTNASGTFYGKCSHKLPCTCVAN
jgi:hypothetical protein